MPKTPSYLTAAFLVPANLVALGGATAASVVYHDPTPILAALGIESLYLAILSSTSGFRRAVRARFGTREVSDEVGGLLEELAPNQREHYFALRDFKEKILANYRKLPGGRILAASSEHQVDSLLTSFLRLLATLNSYRRYLSAGDRARLETELNELKAEVEREPNERVKDVKLRRVEILEKRIERFRQADESREVVSHQLAGIEDLLRLTHEQSIAVRDPASVSHQLEALTAEVAATEETVRELERFMEISEELGPSPSHRERVR